MIPRWTDIENPQERQECAVPSGCCKCNGRKPESHEPEQGELRTVSAIEHLCRAFRYEGRRCAARLTFFTLRGDGRLGLVGDREGNFAL